jgi:hypothetical protein
VQSQHFTAALQLAPALVLGSVLSRAVHQRVNTRFLRGFVLAFALVSGAVLLVSA